ncbi:hypothetical protein THIOKS1690004 [Thiocapsa sp. KS1]|nr:hypothetical protein THIOKS1690004 [Thiocapsa sp. KS1]
MGCQPPASSLQPPAFSIRPLACGVAFAWLSLASRGYLVDWCSARNFRGPIGASALAAGGWRLAAGGSIHRRKARLIAEVHHPDLRSRSGLLAAFDDDAIARLEPGVHQPLVADGTRRLDLALLHLALVVHDQGDRVAATIVLDTLLRNQDGVRADAFLHPSADEHPRQKLLLRVRDGGAQRDRAGSLVDRDLGGLQASRMRMDPAVLEDERHLCLLAVRFLQATVGEGAAQLEQLGAGLCEVDINRIDLLHGRQRFGLVGRYQGTLGDGRASDPPGDRRLDSTIGEVDLRALQGGLIDGDTGHGLLERRLGVVVVFLTHCLGLGEKRIAIGLQPRPIQGRLRARQRGLGAVVSRLVDGRVDLIEHLAGADLAAFGKEPILDKAAHARADLRDPIRYGAAGKLRRQRGRAGDDRDRADLGRRRSRRCGTAAGGLIAAGEEQDEADRPDASDADVTAGGCHEIPRSAVPVSTVCGVDR